MIEKKDRLIPVGRQEYENVILCSKHSSFIFVTKDGLICKDGGEKIMFEDQYYTIIIKKVPYVQ